MNRFTKTLCAFLLSLASLAQGQTNTWIGPATGDWGDPAHWSLGVVPDSPNRFDARVRIDANANENSTVQIGPDQNFSVGELTIDPGDLLTINDGSELRAGPIQNAGDIQVGASGGSPSLLLIQGMLFNLPTSRVTLDSGTVAPFTQFGNLLWNQGTFEGRGLVSVPSIWNEGLIDANGNFAGSPNGNVLAIRGRSFIGGSPPGILINTGELRASGGGILRLVDWLNGSLQNHDNGTLGTIEAQGDSLLFIEDANIIGGRITTSTTGGVQEGRIEFQRSVSLVGVQLDANASFWTGSVLQDSDFANLGTISLTATNFGIAGDVRLAGGGIVEIGGNPRMVGVSNFSNQLPKFVNVDNTFRAGNQSNGSLGQDLLFENYGTLEAIGPLTTLDLVTFGPSELSQGDAAWQNRGLIRAAGGGRIVFQSAGADHPFDNVGGVIEVEGNSFVNLNNTHIVGGTVRGPATPADNGLNFSGQSLLENVRLEGVIESNQDITLVGTIENTGQLTTPQTLRFKGTEVTLTGGGEFSAEGIERSFDQSTPVVKVTNEDNTLVVDPFTFIQEEIHFLNRGTIEARDANVFAELTLGSSEQIVTNSGVIRAIDGATLAIYNAPIENYEVDAFGNVTPGMIQAGANSELTLDGVVGGIVQAAAGGLIRINDRGSLTGSAEAGELQLLGDIQAENRLQLSGTIRNEGQFAVNGSINQSPQLTQHVRLQGSGEMLLAGAQWLLPFSSTLVNGPNHTIATGDNNAQIVTNGNLLINEGRIEARDGRTMRIEHSGSELLFQQRGELLATGGGRLELSQSDGRLANDGLIESKTGSTVIIDFLEQFTNRGSIRVGDQSSFDMLGSSNGQPIQFVNAAGGEIVANSLLTTPVVVNEPGGRISGAWRIAITDSTNSSPRLVNHGVVAPTNASALLGINDHFEVIGDYEQTETGILEIGIGGTDWDQFDKLLVDGTAKLDGSLSVRLFDLDGNGFTPALGDSFEILRITSSPDHHIVGQFDTYSMPVLTDGNSWAIRYNENSVELSVIDSLLADVDRDNDVDGADFLEIQRTNPSLIAQWQTEYGSNVIVTSAASQATVPEPTTAALILLTIVVTSLTRSGHR